MNPVGRYFNDLGQVTSAGWNRFWFTPSDPLPLCVLRLGVGACLLLVLGLLTGDISTWFSQQGLIPPPLYNRMVIDESDLNRLTYWSIFNFLRSPSEAMAFHVMALIVAALFTAGCFSRITGALSLFALLQYMHRAPFVMGQAEPVLAMLLFYLMLGPCGAYLSFDAWRRRRGAPRGLAKPVEPSWTATVSLRLIQIHLAMFYLMMGTAKLHGTIWWRGEGVWALMAMTRSRWFDWSFARDAGYLINAWSHAIVLYELMFGVLIWNRWLRPLVISVGIVLWLLLIPVSGLVSFCLLMIVAMAAFIPAEFWRRP